MAAETSGELKIKKNNLTNKKLVFLRIAKTQFSRINYSLIPDHHHHRQIHLGDVLLAALV